MRTLATAAIVGLGLLAGTAASGHAQNYNYYESTGHLYVAALQLPGISGKHFGQSLVLLLSGI